MELEYRGIVHRAEIDSLELVAAAAPVYQNIVSNLRALYRAEETPAIQLSDRAARMPGLAETLKSRVGGEVFLLEPGATARGLLQRCRDDRDSGGLTLAATSAVGPGAGERCRPATPTARADSRRTCCSATMPTRSATSRWCWARRRRTASAGWICSRTCGVCRAVTASSRSKTASASSPTSSRYGTFLNGHRIDGSAVLQSGDLLRIGTPGFELRLISAEERHGT